jgi:hypothetical protein
MTRQYKKHVEKPSIKVDNNLSIEFLVPFWKFKKKRGSGTYEL